MTRLALLVAVVGVALPAAACGSNGGGVAQLGSTTRSAPSSSPPARQTGALAFARCMRAHGVPSFPDPNAQGDFPSFNAGVSKQISVAASRACKHLLPSGGTASPQQRQQKFAFALKVAACLRKHGYPDFPDPTAAGQHVPPDVDTRSPQFQRTETACEQQARKALGLP